MVPVEEELSALLPAFDALEVLGPVALKGAELPTEVLTEITAEVSRSVEVENQISSLGGQDARAQLAKRRHLAVMYQPID
jgi:hypothetical protein